LVSKKEIEQKAILYLKKHRELLYDTYLKNSTPTDEKVAYFTAGPSGAGKTEFTIEFLKNQNNIIHLDIDLVRDFFKPLGYDGKNSNLFQKPASYGVQFLFDEIVKNRELSIIVDSNLSHFQTAKENVLKLLKHNYKIEIFYIYNELEKCFLYTKKRESVTKRVVPEDVFFKSVVYSRSVTSKIKASFDDSIVLNILDKRDNKIYKNISSKQFEKIIPKYEVENDTEN